MKLIERGEYNSRNFWQLSHEPHEEFRKHGFLVFSYMPYSHTRWATVRNEIGNVIEAVILMVVSENHFNIPPPSCGFRPFFFTQMMDTWIKADLITSEYKVDILTLVIREKTAETQYTLHRLEIGEVLHHYDRLPTTGRVYSSLYKWEVATGLNLFTTLLERKTILSDYNFSRKLLSPKPRVQKGDFMYLAEGDNLTVVTHADDNYVSFVDTVNYETWTVSRLTLCLLNNTLLKR